MNVGNQVTCGLYGSVYIWIIQLDVHMDNATYVHDVSSANSVE